MALQLLLNLLQLMVALISSLLFALEGASMAEGGLLVQMHRVRHLGLLSEVGLLHGVCELRVHPLESLLLLLSPHHCLELRVVELHALHHLLLQLLLLLAEQLPLMVLVLLNVELVLLLRWRIHRLCHVRT
uniref:Secreted protein n=1 Tax=Strombidium inclinatum TaxID=197538 RepID=A0A7S3ILB7_9SPIT